MSNELNPKFVIEVWLDGDDDAQIQAGNVQYSLERAVEEMKAGGIIQDGRVIQRI